MLLLTLKASQMSDSCCRYQVGTSAEPLRKALMDSDLEKQSCIASLRFRMIIVQFLYLQVGSRVALLRKALMDSDEGS